MLGFSTSLSLPRKDLLWPAFPQHRGPFGGRYGDDDWVKASPPALTAGLGSSMAEHVTHDERMSAVLLVLAATVRDRVARIGVAGVGGTVGTIASKASGVAYKDRAGVGRNRDPGRRRMALALAVGEVAAWASGPAQASQARCECAP